MRSDRAAVRPRSPTAAPPRIGFDLAQFCPPAGGYSMLAKSAPSPQRPAMIKDLVVNLSTGASADADAAGDYAISVAETFRAHVLGIAFAYEPILPPSVMGGMPPDMIEAQRAEGENAANALIARFEESIRRAGLSAQSRMVPSSLAAAADLFGQIARRFDLSVVRFQSQTLSTGNPAKTVSQSLGAGSISRKTAFQPGLRTTCCWTH